MVGSSRRRTRRRQMQRAGAAGWHKPPREQPVADDMPINIVDRLAPELLAEIHSHLYTVDFLKRLAFASVCGASGHLFKQEAPCLVLAGPGGHEEKATVFSLADRRAATVRTSDPAMRGHVVLGSSDGWLVTADVRGILRMANPVTGAQTDLPDITTASIPFLSGLSGGNRFSLDVQAFHQIRFGGPPPPGEHDDYWGPIPPRTYTLTACQMRQFCYRKVVLSASPRPGSYAAMLILDRTFGVPAFATAEDPAWRLAPSRDGVEDAIHHRGQFISITYSGVVESWARNAETGEFTSTVHAPKLQLAIEDGSKLQRKYLAAGPDGRLMAVLKFLVREEQRWSYRDTKRVLFKVLVLDEARGRWEEAANIGDSALFVGVNASLCVSAMEHRGIRPSCIYFTDDEIRKGRLCRDQGYTDYDLLNVGMYSLKHGKVDKIVALGVHPRCPPPAWFTPSFL